MGPVAADNGETFPLPQHPTWLSLWESWRRSRLRGQERYILWSLKKPLSAQCAHWAPLPEGEARRRAAAVSYEPVTLVIAPHLRGSPGSLQLNSLGKVNVPFVGRGHAPAAHVRFLYHAPSSTAPKPSPSGGGRWPGKAGSDEGRNVTPTTSARTSSPQIQTIFQTSEIASSHMESWRYFYWLAYPKLSAAWAGRLLPRTGLPGASSRQAGSPGTSQPAQGTRPSKSRCTPAGWCRRPCRT